MKFRPRYLLYLLSALALFNFAKWSIHFISSEYRPLDFRTYYLAGEAYQAGMNPWDEKASEQIWQSYDSCTTGEWKTGIGIPHAAVVYSPQFIWFFKPFNAFEFTSSKWLQFGLNIIFLFGICYLISKLNPLLKLHQIAIALAAFRGTWFALDNGQPIIAVSFIILLALYCSREKEKPLLSGLLLGIIGFKFTLLIPIVIWLLLNRRYKTIVMIILTGLSLNLPIIIFHKAYLYTWIDNMDRMWMYINSGETNGLSIINCNAIANIVKVDVSVLKPLSSVIYLSSFAYIFIKLKLKKIAYHEALFLLALTEICFGQHLMYDLLLLISIFAITDFKQNIWITWPLILALTFPIGSLAEKINFPELNYVLPFALLAYWIYVQSTLPPSKYKEIKNPS
ncbi:MAG TPA: glycosyltransferase family 87 protein [Bacteroidia bacterium]